MTDLSNKTLAMLLVAAIVVSFGGTLISLNKLGEAGFTGRAASDTGETNFSIQSDITITFTDATLDFGAGYVNDTTPGAPTENCTLNSDTAAPAGDCVGFNDATSDGLAIQNDGNQDVNLNLTSNATADTHLFPSGDAGISSLKWKFGQGQGTACSAGFTPTTYAEIANTNPLTVCTDFNSDDSNDLISMDVELVIPQNALPGTRKVQFTALGYS